MSTVFLAIVGLPKSPRNLTDRAIVLLTAARLMSPRHSRFMWEEASYGGDTGSLVAPAVNR